MTNYTDYLTNKLILPIRAIREAAYVERCHVAGKTSGYNLAQHQYGVAVLCMLFWPDEPKIARVGMFHDVAERWVGDIPSTALRTNPDLKHAVHAMETRICTALALPCEDDLTSDELRKLKAADRLDLYLWTVEECRRRGSTEFLGFQDQLARMWREEAPPEPVASIWKELAQQSAHRLPEIFEEI